MGTLLRISPAIMLGGLVALTVLAALLESASRRRRRQSLRRLAADWRMNYSPHDRLRLSSIVATRFPVPGAADIYVLDVIYGIVDGMYRYVFTAEYTIGVIRSKRRQVRAATFCEPRGREADSRAGPVCLAQGDVPLLAQYHLLAPPSQSPVQVPKA